MRRGRPTTSRSPPFLRPVPSRFTGSTPPSNSRLSLRLTLLPRLPCPISASNGSSVHRTIIATASTTAAGLPELCAGTEDDKRFPDPGEVVTFTAQIANQGVITSPAVSGDLDCRANC